MGFDPGEIYSSGARAGRRALNAGNFRFDAETSHLVGSGSLKQKARDNFAAIELSLLMDNGGAHRAKALKWPARVVPVYLPAYCPELNPIECWWRELKDAVADTLFGSLDALRVRLDEELAAWNQGAERLCSLTTTLTSSTLSPCWINPAKRYYPDSRLASATRQRSLRNVHTLDNVN